MRLVVSVAGRWRGGTMMWLARDGLLLLIRGGGRGGSSRGGSGSRGGGS